MARRVNRTGRNSDPPPFVMLPLWLMDTVAWRSLTPKAISVYLRLMRRFNGINNGSIALSNRDAASECHITANTVTRAFQELMEKGFIAIVTKGSFRWKVRHATEWRLTHHRCELTGDRATCEFKKWRPGE